MSRAILLPVFNEEETIGTVLDAVRRTFDGLLIVIDDGSTDETTRVLAARGDVRVLRHERNLGYGQSLIDGFAAAVNLGVERLITMDCDGQHEPRHITQFFDALDATEFVSGSRYLPESRTVGFAPSDRRAVNSRITAEVNRVTGWTLTDAFCGFKAYRTSVLRGLRLREPGYGQPLELWARLFQRGVTPLELAVERIYLSHNRSFGRDLDDPDKRLAYYMRVWETTLADRP